MRYPEKSTTSAERDALAYKIAKRIGGFGTVDIVKRKKKMPHHRYPGESLTTSAKRNALAYKIAKGIKAFGRVDVVERKREDATSSLSSL